jgi:hypothetical protein
MTPHRTRQKIADHKTAVPIHKRATPESFHEPMQVEIEASLPNEKEVLMLYAPFLVTDSLKFWQIGGSAQGFRIR